MNTTYSRAEIVRRGQEMYDRDIRPKVEAGHQGQFLALDVESGEYVLGPDSLTVLQRAQARDPDAPIYVLRVGFPTAVKIGARRA